MLNETQVWDPKSVRGTCSCLTCLVSNQGHANPLLRLLSSKGLLVTFSAPESCGAEMKKANPKISNEPSPYGSGMMRFDFFEDEWDHPKPDGNNLELYLQHLELIRKKILPTMINKYSEQGHPVCVLSNNPFIPWVCDVAESLGIPSAMLWVQSFSSIPSESQPEIDIQLRMPLLKYDEVPKLEHDVVNYLSKKFPIKTVGPLFKHPEELAPTSNDVKGDFMKVENCTDWLDIKSPSSIVYISFGSVVILKQEQAEEIAYGLSNSGVNFLWVIKPPTKAQNFDPLVLPDGFLEKAGDRVKIVQWCPQEQVLSHTSVAFLVTLCGWNSTMEALSSGMPVLAFPQWGDQVTDAKHLVDVFKIGLRLCRGEAKTRIIPREEVEKCVREATNGQKAAEIKENALKWKKKAEEAVGEGGSSERNLQAFWTTLEVYDSNVRRT
ncbi:unnamed protein product [Withania somnifera]